MSPLETLNMETYTASPDLAGMPHLSVPCGYDDGGMPIGLQFIADHWNESLLFSIGEQWGNYFDVVRPEVSI